MYVCLFVVVEERCVDWKGGMMFGSIDGLTIFICFVDFLKSATLLFLRFLEGLVIFDCDDMETISNCIKKLYDVYELLASDCMLFITSD